MNIDSTPSAQARANIGDQISKDSPIPLYKQLKMAIEELIESGRWSPNSQVPSERQLCEIFQISRITVRQAINELVEEGRLVRSHGRGTFVGNALLKKHLLPLIGFSQEIQARGQKPGAKVLQFDVTQAPAVIAKALEITQEQKILVVKRLRLADFVPMAVEVVHLPVGLCGDLKKSDLENQSLYEMLKRKVSIIPSRASQQWQAVACPLNEAKLLGIPDKSPVFRIQRTTYTKEDVPFEYVDSFFRGDKYVFHAELYNENEKVFNS